MRIGTIFRKELLEIINVKSGKKDIILDVGCFDGYWLSTQKAKERYGLDINIENRYKNIKYIQGSALDIPFSKGVFNKVFAFDVIEHLPSGTEAKFLSELIRVTNVKGSVYLTFPSDQIRVWPKLMNNFVSRKWGHYKYHGLNKNQIRNFFKKNKNVTFYVRDLNTRNYLKFYLFLRFLWSCNEQLSKKIIKKIASLDAKSLEGEMGYYLLTIKKNRM